MLYTDPLTGITYVLVGDSNILNQEKLISVGNIDTVTPTCQQSPQWSVVQPTSKLESAGGVDELLELTKLLHQRNTEEEDVIPEVVSNIARELASSIDKLSPSPPSPSSSTMNTLPRHNEQLPGISSLTSFSPDVTIHMQSYPFFQPVPLPPPQRPLSLHLPSLSFPTVHSPSSPSYISPPESPKRRKKNFTKEFNIRFQELLSHNEEAAEEWEKYAQRHKGKCSIRRAPCIKVSRGFCASHGREFAYLAKDEKYMALGSRTECNCKHKPEHSPSSSSDAHSSMVNRKKINTRSAPYHIPNREENNSGSGSSTHSGSDSRPDTPRGIELPSPEAVQRPALTKQAWISFLHEASSILHEGFNEFMGGQRCSACAARRSFRSSDEVVAYLMCEVIPCVHEGCRGTMQVHQ